MFPYLKILFIFSAMFFAACGGSSRPATPVETLKAYHIAARNKDTTMMKLLLSAESLKLHQDEAKARGVTLDEIVREQTLFPPDQRRFDYRNEIVENDKATVEVKNAFGDWDIIYLIRESGTWKIDRKGTSDRTIRDIREKNKKLNEMIKKGREKAAETPSATAPDDDLRDRPDVTPTPPIPVASPSPEDSRAGR